MQVDSVVGGSSMRTASKLWPVVVGIMVAIASQLQRSLGGAVARGTTDSDPLAASEREVRGGEERRSASRAGLFGLALDFTKVGAALYVLGLLISSAYCSQFNIVAFDLLRPHAILEGLTALLLLAAPPVLLLSAGRQVKRQPLRTLGPLLLLAALDSGLLAVIGPRALPSAASLGCILALVQIAALTPLLAGSVPAFDPNQQAAHRSGGRLAVGAIIALSMYVILIFPHLQVQYGGGRPYHVQLFPKTPDLVASRFALTKNRPRVNPVLDSFKVLVLYESEKDFYLLEERGSAATLEGYAVIRVPKDEVLRLDYSAPRWVHIGKE
jgi:hypothetical protein